MDLITCLTPLHPPSNSVSGAFRHVCLQVTAFKLTKFCQTHYDSHKNVHAPENFMVYVVLTSRESHIRMQKKGEVGCENYVSRKTYKL